MRREAMSEQISKSDIVLLLIKKADGIKGKKSLQKSLYFFNLNENIFKFRWGDFGPICDEIQQIAKDLTAKGNILVEDIPTLKKEAVLKNMIFSEKNNPDFTKIVFPSSLEGKLTVIINFIRGRNARDLELLASVHYWAVKQQSLLDEYSAEYVHDKLTELKPDVGFTLKNVQEAIKTLEEAGYLQKSLEEN